MSPPFRRESGILLHPTSLPGPYGIGEIGAQALRWLEQLRAMGQGIWQLLPLGPTGFGDSPYQSPSTFAGSTPLIDLEALVGDGLLDAGALASPPAFAADRADLGWALPWRQALLGAASEAFHARASSALAAGLDEFRQRHAAWLDDWALFDALKRAHGGAGWTAWPPPLRDREPAALAAARERLRREVETATVLQFLFDRQWSAVRRRARELGVRLIGDIPIFVAHDSADVWQRPELFLLGDGGAPTVVAGVPPDYFSATGQRWGNPLYDWPAHAAEGYAWWAARVGRALETVDVVRIDHFRGFAAHWEIAADEPTAEHGRWVPGPGVDLFDSLRARLGELPIIAEDLGLITPDVEELRDRLALPGMRVLEFAFDGDPANPHLPDNYVENCVAYTGTHDNEPLAAWIAAAGREERARLRRWLGAKGRARVADLAWASIDKLLASRAGAVVIPLQDVLGLGSEARMNTPGQEAGNWRWRFRWEDLRLETKERMREATVRGLRTGD